MRSKPDYLHYLSHLAKLGTPHLHAFGEAGTGQLRKTIQWKAGERILEIGCGTGETLRQLRSESISVDGVDLLEEMLQSARQRLRLSGLRANLIRADATALPLADRSYAAVFCESVLGLHSAERARVFLSEVARVLQPGGRFVANEGIWKPGTPAAVMERITQSCIDDFGFAPVAMNESEMQDAIEHAGLRLVSAELLQDIPNTNGSDSWQSRWLTLFLQIRAYFNAESRRQRRRYRLLLAKHDQLRDRDHFEVRLFVMRKPVSVELSSIVS